MLGGGQGREASDRNGTLARQQLPDVSFQIAVIVRLGEERAVLTQGAGFLGLARDARGQDDF